MPGRQLSHLSQNLGENLHGKAPSQTVGQVGPVGRVGPIQERLLRLGGAIFAFLRQQQALEKPLRKWRGGQEIGPKTSRFRDRMAVERDAQKGFEQKRKKVRSQRR